VVHHLRVGVAAGAADLDRDGRAELLVADLAEQKLVIHRDALGADALLAVPMPAPTRLASALDVNGDGAPDLVLGRGAAPGTIAVALARPVAAGGAPDLGAHELGAPDTAVDVAVEDRGVAPLAVSGVALSGAAPGDFAITADACSDTTVPGGGRCRLRVRFHPTAVGARSAQIVISDARGEVLRLALAGTGLASTAVRVGCASRPNDHRRRLRCAVVLGPGPAPGRLALRLVRGGHAWARAEVRTGGRLVLRAPRPLARGRYTLVASVVATDGRSGETRRDVTVV
jgi:hypothetical protein